MKNLRLALAALVFALPLAACTQPVGEAATSTDPLAVESQVAPALTKIEAKFARWIPSPTGQTVGMLLDDGTFVRVHDDTKTDALAAGDVVQVEGFKHDATFVRASVKKGDAVIVEASKEPDHHAFKAGGKHGKWAGKKGEGHHKSEGKKGHHGKWEGKKHAPSPEMQKAIESLAPMTVKGTITAVLPGRHGKVHAVILSDGTVAYAKHHAGADLSTLKKGDAVEVSGKGSTWAIGKSMIADSVTPVDAKPL